MHYYKFSIGDYAAATRHLSMLEHGAYRLLLDLYYTSEQPIPLDMKAAARKAGARTKDEVQAVETILREFFTETESGWTHARCDSEIAAFKAKTETNRAVGRLGGRPKKETQTVSDGNQEKTQTVSENNPQETLTTNQEPLTINQLKELEPSVLVETGVSTPGPDPDFESETVVQIDRVPYQKIVDLYHEVLPELRMVVKLSPARQASIRQRWKHDLPDLDEWRKYFEHVRGSAFLMGKAQAERHWEADFDFLINGTNAIKIVEGKYHG